MGFFSRFKDKQDSAEPAAASFTVAPRVKSAYYPSTRTKAPPNRPQKTPGPLLHGTVGIERTESYGSAILSPLAQQRLAGGKSSDALRSPPAPQIEYSGDHQFAARVELYRGSISTVFRALCLESQQTVIIKVYDRIKMKAKNFQRLEREVRLMKLLAGGSGVVRLYGSYEDDDHVTLVMEFCQSGDLFKTMLMHGGALDEHWVAAQVIAPLLRVLVRTHALHILHRDIKPENLFLTRRRSLMLGDFGLAIRCDEELPFTRSGTLDYMAPEVLANPSSEVQEGREVTRDELRAVGIRPYDEKVDVWAAGVLAYELLVGKPPFEVKNEAQTVNRILTCNTINFPAKHSPLWADFVRQALEKRPHLRPPASALLDHPWLLFHDKKHAREAGHSPAVEDMLRAPLPEILVFKTPKPLPGDSVTTISASPSMARPALSSLVVEAHAKIPAGGKPSELAARRSVSMGSQALQASINQKLKLLETRIAETKPLKLHSPSSATGGARLDRLELEGSGASFTSLVQAVPEAVHVPGRNGYVHSGDYISHEQVLAEGESTAGRAKGGMHTRMIHYFDRQKNT